MKKLFYVVVASVAMLVINLTACSDDEFEAPDSVSVTNKEEYSNLEIALQNAKHFFNKLVKVLELYEWLKMCQLYVRL